MVDENSFTRRHRQAIHQGNYDYNNDLEGRISYMIFKVPMEVFI